MSELVVAIYLALAGWWAVNLWRQRKCMKPAEPPPSVCDRVVMGCVHKVWESERYIGSEFVECSAWQVITLRGELYRVTVSREKEKSDHVEF